MKWFEFNKKSVVTSCVLAGVLLGLPIKSSHSSDVLAAPDPEKNLIQQDNQRLHAVQLMLQRQLSGKTAGQFDDGQTIAGIFSGGGMANANQAAILTAMHDLTVMGLALRQNGGHWDEAVDVVTAYQNNPKRAYEENIGGLRALDEAVGSSAGVWSMLYSFVSNAYIGTMNYTFQLVQKGPDGRPLFMDVPKGFDNALQTLSGSNAKAWSAAMAAASHPAGAILKYFEEFTHNGFDFRRAFQSMTGFDKGPTPRGLDMNMLEKDIRGGYHPMEGLDVDRLAAQNKTPFAIAVTDRAGPERVFLHDLKGEEIIQAGLASSNIMGIGQNAPKGAPQHYDAKLSGPVPVDGVKDTPQTLYVVFGPAPMDKGIEQSFVSKAFSKIVDAFCLVLTENWDEARKIMSWGENKADEVKAHYKQLEKEGRLVYLGAPAGYKAMATTEMNGAKLTAEAKATYENFMEEYGVQALLNMGLVKGKVNSKTLRLPKAPSIWDSPARDGTDAWYDNAVKGGTASEKALMDRYDLGKGPSKDVSQIQLQKREEQQNQQNTAYKTHQGRQMGQKKGNPYLVFRH